MYEYIRINEKDGYIDMPSKAGVVNTASGICLIDSGNDKDAAKKILKAVEGNISWILNTHSHADHMGGNSTIQDRTGCSIYLPGIEKSIAEHPVLEPLMLYGGKPLKGLKNKFLMAKPSVPSEAFEINGISMISLPGHSMDMTCYLTEDRTAYIGDVITSKEILDKYGISYTYDIAEALSSMEKVKEIDADVFVPAHADVQTDIAPLADYNIVKMREAGEVIHGICSEERTFEDILKLVFERYEMTMNVSQYALIGSTVRAYLGWLEETDEIEYFFEDNNMYWRIK